MVFYIILFITLAILFTFILITITCINCLGLSGLVKKMIGKYSTSSYDRQFQQNTLPINSQCFICLENIKNQVVATCNHSYCASCIISYIENKGNIAIDCPACRKSICVLFRKFNPSSTQDVQLKDKISLYNFKHSKQPDFTRSITQFFNIVKHAPMLISQDGIRFLLSNPRVKIILFMVIYTLSPFDLLPEVILGPLGLADDSLVFINILRQVSGLLINFTGDERNRNLQNERRNN